MESVNVVISGFDPYEGVERNPSRIVVEQFAREGIDPQDNRQDDFLSDVRVNITPVMLPISFEKAWEVLEDTLEEQDPNVVIATGFARSARGMLLERCAVNLMDISRKISGKGMDSGLSGEPDMDEHGPIDHDGPAAFWTRLPLRAILDDFGRDDIPAALSSDAGTFVCNSLFYNLMKWATARHRHVISGFVSLPAIVDAPHAQHGLTVGQQVQACRDVVREAVSYYFDPSSSDILIG
ncbi:pyroglutamyl-peptidase I [Bifidobacterium bombi]|uniref:Pyroglutamyl-peptidase I n=1 Tax=Bifidobacterium bombi DSM 19703 TaxID=1341695 RepID=A0A080N321_9BIFI|nr:pyroglutamyl-peptidase I [Bifidobacterium bombi]KFF31498.1 pyroglutamyl-peptidase [Bifidobacterium bombi DSM 19703]